MLQVAEHLLEQFHRTYPGIKKVFYAGVIAEIAGTHMLTSQAVHYCEDVATWAEDFASQVGSWTRYCFGDPSKSKPMLNSYIAHPPQNLNAITLNKAYLKVFHDIAINPKYSSHFKLGPQVHDSIIGQHRIGHEYLRDMVVERMQIPLTIKGYDGVIRSFTVLADTSNSGDYWSELK